MNYRIGGILVTAGIAAASSAISVSLSLPVWLLFAGWISFLVTGGRAGTLPVAFACVMLGIVLGMGGGLAIPAGTPAMGSLAVPLTVFLIVSIALAAQFLPLLNKVIGYFIGMTVFFAFDHAANLATGLTLGAGILLGLVSGLAAVTLSSRLDAMGDAQRAQHQIPTA